MATPSSTTETMNASKGFYPTFLYWMEGEEQEPTGIISKLHTTRLMSTVDHQHPYPVRFQYIEVLSDVHGPTPVLPPAFDVCSTYRCWAYFSFFLLSLISLIADGPHHYHHPACGHKGSSHLSPVHALQFFIAMQVQHSYNSSASG